MTLGWNGKRSADRGYDRATETFLTEDWTGLPLPAAPDQNDAREAMRVLLDPFSDFPFADERCKAAFAAHILHMLVRHLLPTVPAVVYSAPTAGSGKTLLATTPSIVVHGRGPTTMAAVQERGADDEMRKRITACLLASRTDVLHDNLSRGQVFAPPAVDVMLTTPEWSDRILGGSTTVKTPNTLTFAVTGNNLRLAQDTARRVVAVYLDPGHARPETRQEFRHPDLVGHLHAQRSKLLAAALTVLRAHFMHNDPLGAIFVPSRTLGSFETWARAVAAAVEWVGLPNPIATQEWWRVQFGLGGAEGEVDALGELLAAAAAMFGPDRFTAAELLAASRAAAFENLEEPAAVTAEQRQRLGEALEAAVLGVNSSSGNRLLGKFLASHANQTTPSGAVLKRVGERRGVATFVVQLPSGPAPGARGAARLVAAELDAALDGRVERVERV
ncbi:MAG TPA: hypothetical protein VEX11_06440 [Acetobacteraceae bacterium]|nr:hypothetical protein [Acetobacteraceae bacterium]